MVAAALSVGLLPTASQRGSLLPFGEILRCNGTTSQIVAGSSSGIAACMSPLFVRRCRKPGREEHRIAVYMKSLGQPELEHLHAAVDIGVWI